MRWIIDQIHVLRPIRFTHVRRNEISAKIPVTGKTGVAAAMKSRRGVLGIAVADNRQQRAAMVLRDVHYGVAASVEVLDQEDRDGAPLQSAVAKHLEMFKRRASRGQYFHHPYLGVREFPASFRLVEEFPGFCCNFGPATSGWTVFDNDWTGSPIMPSDNPFKWRQFEPGLILLCVRWYLRYAVSYRDLEEMIRERGLCVDHTTIYRWVQRYAPEIDKRCRPFLRRTTDSYRIDETYVRVGGAWHYLYRGVDSNGDTLDFLLRATRDRNAAIAFFRKTVGASHTTLPRVVNVDKNPAYPIAFEAIKHEGLFRPRSSLRQCKYLNNVIEQDHRFIKRRTRPMLGFKRFTTAWRTVRGIEMMHALRKGQARWMAKGDVVGQTRLIHKVFGLAV